jgi:hypothetical protein
MCALLAVILTHERADVKNKNKELRHGIHMTRHQATRLGYKRRYKTARPAPPWLALGGPMRPVANAATYRPALIECVAELVRA